MMAGDLVVSTINGAPIGVKNALINGDFRVNQRGVSGTVSLSAGQYGHDRFKAGASGCTYTFATVNNVTTITISAGSLMQVIEGINLWSGTYVLSWSGTAQGRIDSGSYGSSGITGTAVGGTNQTVEWGTGTLSFVQYERGSVATAFEYLDYSEQLRRCQRYYAFYLFNEGGGTTGPTGFADTTTSAIITMPTVVPMRAAATAMVASAASDYQLRIAGGTSVVCSSAPSLANATTASLMVTATVASGLTAGQCVVFRGGSSGKGLGFSAEL
jgi:hypothetical protein